MGPQWRNGELPPFPIRPSPPMSSKNEMCYSTKTQTFSPTKHTLRLTRYSKNHLNPMISLAPPSIFALVNKFKNGLTCHLHKFKRAPLYYYLWGAKCHEKHVMHMTKYIMQQSEDKYYTKVKIITSIKFKPH